MKQMLLISGQPLYPITVGKPAWIKEKNGERQTTPVQRILAQKERYILFETKNTVYQLLFERTETNIITP